VCVASLGPLAILPDGRPSFDQNLDALLERKRRLHAETLAPPAAEEKELDELFERTVGRVFSATGPTVACEVALRRG